MSAFRKGFFLLGLFLLVFSCRSNPPYDQESPLEQLRADHTGKLRDQFFREHQDERDKMVDGVIAKNKGVPITDPRVIRALRKVPRHAFLTVRYLVENRAYIDRPVSIGYGFQTMTGPSEVAIMMQLLGVKPGEKVLEIGTGSSYQAALLAEITSHVYSIEIIKQLGQEAAERLKLLGYTTVQTRIGDGYFGWPQAAPFDAIIVTCAAGHIPPPLLSQLANGGRMVIPVGSPNQLQRLIFVTKDSEGNLKTEDRMPIRFVPMTGSSQPGNNFDILRALPPAGTNRK
jgi:protein-L-isoaspartate(D-aspartate) O-methyltransferase